MCGISDEMKSQISKFSLNCFFPDLLNRLESAGDRGSPNGDTRSHSRSRSPAPPNDEEEEPPTRQRKRTTSHGSDEAPAYTKVQVEAVRHIRRCKDYYEILGNSLLYLATHYSTVLVSKAAC